MHETGTTMFYILTKEILNFYHYSKKNIFKKWTIAYDDINKIIVFLNKIKT